VRTLSVFVLGMVALCGQNKWLSKGTVAAKQCVDERKVTFDRVSCSDASHSTRESERDTDDMIKS
jgi:hypothetical protein